MYEFIIEVSRQNMIGMYPTWIHDPFKESGHHENTMEHTEMQRDITLSK